MSKQRTTESKKAQDSRRAKDARYAAMQQKYATRDSMLATQGSNVFSVTVPQSMREFLVRRLSLFQMIGAEHWGNPLTEEVRKIMIRSNRRSAANSARWDKYEQAARALVRAAVIIPPEPLLREEIQVEEITADMCRPLYVDVGETPDDDQIVLLPELEYQALDDRSIVIRSMKRKSAEVKSELAEIEARLEVSAALAFQDLAALAGVVVESGPGSLNRFRPIEIHALGVLANTESN